VWPFQWRVGISSLCGFFIFYLFTPVLLVAQGPVVAGQFGMTLAIANGIQNVTTAWLNSQAPHFGQLVAAGRYGDLNAAFARTLRRSTSVALLGALSAVTGLIVAMRFAPALASRLLPSFPFALLMISALVNHVIFGIAVYLRAHRKEPLLVLSVIGAAAMSIIVPWTAHVGNTTTVAASYLGLNVVGFAAGLVIWGACRRRWHQARPALASDRV
jgi:hypothetical protein